MEASGFLLILSCLVVGILLRRSGRLPSHSQSVLNALVLQLALPALVLLKMHELFRVLHGDRDTWIPISMPWIQFGGVAVISCLAGRFLGWSRRTLGTVILMAGLGNTSFVGFPLLDSIFGPRALPVGILVDQPGSFLVFSTLGVLTATLTSDEAPSLSASLRRVAFFPPMVALVLSALLSPFEMPQAVSQVLEKISAILIPVALVSVGFQLQVSRAAIARRLGALATGLGFKLVLVPAVMTLIYFYGMGSRGFTTQVTLVESAMAPMITAAILVDESGLDHELATLMIGVGIPLSLLSVPAWAWLLRQLA
jgi:predicted permease